MRYFAAAAAVLACVLAGAALSVSVTGEGPRGPQGPPGPQGQTGRNAQVAHLGLCVNIGVSTGVLYVQNYAAGPVSSPVLTDGVPSCPDGQFVSIVPQAAS